MEKNHKIAIIAAVIIIVAGYFLLPQIFDTNVEVKDSYILEKGNNEYLYLDMDVQEGKEVGYTITCFGSDGRELEIGNEGTIGFTHLTNLLLKQNLTSGLYAFEIPPGTKTVEVKIISTSTENVLYDENTTNIVKSNSKSNPTVIGYSQAFVNNILNRYDSNNDNKISSSEYEDMCLEAHTFLEMKRYDTDKDGYFSKKELHLASNIWKYGIYL